MRVGKLTPEELNQHVFRHLVQRRPEILVRSALGEDSMLLDLGDSLCVMSTDPITGAARKSGWLAVHVSANDVAANGAEPICCLMTILAPPNCPMAEIEQVMVDAAKAAEELNIEISGGHTELTSAVCKIVLSTTVVGKARRDHILRTDGAKAGDDIVVTKTIGLEGTAILAQDAKEHMLTWFSSEELAEAEQFINQISVVPEGLAATVFGVHAMHDITEGGLLGATFEMASGAGLGFDLFGDRIPVHPLTTAFCERLQLDVFRFLSSGTMLIACPNGEALVRHLHCKGISASVIGQFRQNKDKRILAQEQWLSVLAPEGDELWRGLERIKTK
jgi:hydrogenase maturation factor